MSASRPRARSVLGFTLAEMLVVGGIIAILMALLIPSLSAARRHAERVTCMNNLRQVATAYGAYTIDYRGDLPGSARRGDPRDDDYLHWQSDRNPRHSALARYLGGDPRWAFVCPADDPELRQAAGYPYSFVLNMFFDANPDTSVYPAQLFTYSLANLPRSSEKVLFYEADPARLDDGVGNPRTAPMAVDLLSLRHDTTPLQADVVQSPLLPPDVAYTRLPNVDRAGNAAFVDGHAEFVTREVLHNPRYHLPLAP